MRRLKRNEVPCVLQCGDMTRDPDSVCDECRAVVRDAKEFKKLRRAVNLEMERAQTVAYWHIYEWSGDPRTSYNTETNRLREALIALAGGQAEYIYRTPPAWHELPDAGVPGPIGISPKSSMFSGDTYLLVAPKGKAALILEAYEACCNLVAHYYVKGKQAGENMLQRLADGELSMADLADPSTRKRH